MSGPHANLDAEQAVLGAWLVAPDTFDPSLSPTDFFRDAHQRIAEAMGRLQRAGKTIDLIPLLDELQRTGELDDVGRAYCTKLTDGVPSRTTNVTEYIRIVRTKAAERRAMRNLALAQEALKAGNAGGARALVADFVAGDDGDDDAQHGPAVSYPQRLADEVERERARREAKRTIDAEERGAIRWPEVLTLRDRLKRPRLPKSFRVAEIQPRGTRALLAAQFKCGKTSFKDNLIRSLVDGDPFLGRYQTTQLSGRVLDLDLELSEDMGDDWKAAQRIKHDDRVIFVSCKGKGAALNFLDAGTRAMWVEYMRSLDVRYVILDCLRPVLDALGLDENRDGGRFLTAFDAMLDEAAVPEALVVHHMGHGSERSRGDSKFRDWPDCEWKLVRKDDDPSSPRFFSAYGRDVDVREHGLIYNAQTRRLTAVGGSRRDAKAAEVLAEVEAVLRQTPELSGRAVKDALSEAELGKDAIDAALAYGVKTGALSVRDGARRAKLYRLRVSECPAVSGFSDTDTSVLCPTPYKGADTRTLKTHPGEADGVTF